MSKMIQLRNVPEALHRTLKARAATAGMSLSDYLLAEIREVAERPTVSEFGSAWSAVNARMYPGPRPPSFANSETQVDRFELIGRTWRAGRSYPKAGFWWTWSGSNRRPLPCHGSALAAAPHAHCWEKQRNRTSSIIAHLSRRVKLI